VSTVGFWVECNAASLSVAAASSVVAAVAVMVVPS